MIGIYKITSPTKKVYIGQSVNIERRFKYYKNLKSKKQPRIHLSLLKYGVYKHKFEILCECEVNELNDKERYYQDVFSSTGKNGLNCVLTKSTDRSGKLSEEHNLKISKASKGKIRTEEHCKNLSESMKGKIASEETRKKMSLWQIGKKLSKETCEKFSIAKKGNKHSLGFKQSEETKKKRSESMKGYVHSEFTKIKMSESKRKIILNTQTGIFYFGNREAAKTIGIKEGTLKARLMGQNKNKTPFIYC